MKITLFKVGISQSRSVLRLDSVAVANDKTTKVNCNVLVELHHTIGNAGLTPTYNILCILLIYQYHTVATRLHKLIL